MGNMLLVRFSISTALALGDKTVKRECGQEDMLPAAMATQLARAGVVTVLGTPEQLRAERTLGPSGAAPGAVAAPEHAQEPAKPARRKRRAAKTGAQSQAPAVKPEQATAEPAELGPHVTRDTAQGDDPKE